ncbi:MAG TPA: PHP domain-containing protein [Candidatus Dormibacteraeota bacterium]|nr:PHP domain-containing protein [Candidatus Dormibacteraeota bacterium]
MALADPHCHTFASDGMVTPAELVDGAVQAGLDLIAITDHDTMAAAREVVERGEAAGLTVVAGQEVTTKWPAQTHMLGWFLEKPIRRSMSLGDTAAAIHDQGGLVIIPHPFMPLYFGSIQPGMLRRLIEKEPVDGIEVMFTVPIGARRRKMLDDFISANRERLGASIGASDCHFGRHDIAQVLTEYEGDFRTAVVQRKTAPRQGPRKRQVPRDLFLRQQWSALVELPIRRLRHQL